MGFEIRGGETDFVRASVIMDAEIAKALISAVIGDLRHEPGRKVTVAMLAGNVIDPVLAEE